MKADEAAAAKAHFEAFLRDPKSLLHSPDLEWAICHALGEGGWDVYPGDGVALVANMMRWASGQAGDLLDRVQALLDDVEAVARDSFSTSAETWEADWEIEEPDGYRAWRAVRDALPPRPAPGRAKIDPAAFPEPRTPASSGGRRRVGGSS